MKIIFKELEIFGQEIIDDKTIDIPKGKYFNYHWVYSGEWLNTDIIIASC